MPTIESLLGLDRDKAAGILYRDMRPIPQILEEMTRLATLDGSTADFYPIYQFKEGEQPALKRVWDKCFGEDGYLLNQSPEEIERDKFLVETGAALMHWAHQDQVRGTGDPASSHMSAIVEEYVDKYRPPAWIITGLYCHDVVEDSPVTLEVVEHLLGPQVAAFVDAMTKLDRSQMKLDRASVVLKFIGSFQSIATILGKMFDRGHNVETLHGKPLKDQINTAGDTLEIFYFLAKIIGLHEEADRMADRCIEIWDAALHDPDLVNSIKQGIEDNLDPINLDKIREYISSVMADTSVQDVVVRKPGPFAIYQSLNGRREVRQDDFYINIDVSLDDGTLNMEALNLDDIDRAEEVEFGRQASDVASRLGFKNHFDVPDRNQSIGIRDSMRRSKTEVVPYHEFRLAYVENGRRIPVHIKVYRKRDYDLVQTPLTYIDAVSLSKRDSLAVPDEDHAALFRYRQELAREKLRRNQERFDLLAEQYADNPEGLVEAIVITLPDSVTVTGKKVQDGEVVEHIRRPLRRGDTVLDYALTVAPNSWWRVRGVDLNDKEVEDYGVYLREGDVISLDFGGKRENFVDVSWLSQVNEKHRVQVAQKLQDKIDSLRAKRERLLGWKKPNLRMVKQTEEEIDRLVRSIRHTGFLNLLKEIENLDDFGLGSVSHAFPDPDMDSRDYAYQVGLGIDPIITASVPVVIEAAKAFWNGLTVVVVPIPHTPAQLNRLTEIISAYNLNIIKSTSKSKWGDTARIVFRFNKKDPEYHSLEKVLLKLSDLGYPPRVFENNQLYQEWLTNYQYEVD